MRAIVQDAYGDAGRAAPGRVARPEVGADEVLVQVAAAGLDRGTWHLMTGLPYRGRLAFGLREPKQPVPGLDLAGRGRGGRRRRSRRFQVGDEVFGIGEGSFAEYAVGAGGQAGPQAGRT